MANKATLKPFKKGEDPRRHKKQKGERSFKTIFKEAAKEVAKALRLGEKPNAIEIELVKRGIREGLGGKYPFYQDLIDRLYGKAKSPLEIGGGENPIRVISIKKYEPKRVHRRG